MITRQIIKLATGKHIILEVTDARTIILTTNLPAVACNGLSKITELIIGDEIYINLDSPFKKFMFSISEESPKLVYDIQSIRQLDTGKFMLSTHNRTVSSYFLSPMLEFDKDWFKWDYFFINTYFVRLRQPIKAGSYRVTNGDKYAIGMLYRFIPSDNYRIFELELMKHPQFLFHYDMDYQTCLFVFRPKEQHLKDMDIIGEGRYSKLSEKFKQQILQFHKFPSDGEMAQILSRSKIRQQKLELKLGVPIPDDIDLLDKIDFGKELITINEY